MTKSTPTEATTVLGKYVAVPFADGFSVITFEPERQDFSHWIEWKIHLRAKEMFQLGTLVPIFWCHQFDGKATPEKAK